jgi:very-short-patch-repair endonuclease
MGKSSFIKHNAVANAEWSLYDELIRKGFNFETQRQFVLTSADFYFPDKRIAIFLDGNHHLKQKQEKFDGLVDEVLGSWGISVMRFPYSAPITKKALRNVVNEIEGQLRG